MKIESFYPQKDDNELQFAFNDTHEICIGDIDKVTFGFDVCTNKNNPSYSIYGQPKYSINAKPLNDLNLLMIGDSFATNHSQLYSSTFKNIWKSHYSHMQGKNLTKFIHNNKPDVVIYQVVERAFFRNSLVKNLSLINPVNENHVTLKKEIFDIYNDKYNYANNQKFSLKNQIYHIIKKDPHIILNNTYANSEYSVINIDINSDQESLLQIFYKPRKTLTYSELNSFRYKIKKGTNNITLEVPSHYINNQLRIDLGHNLGTYQLNKFLIHQI